MRLREGRREIKVFCPLHKIDFAAVPGSKIVCEHGFHSLADDFPYDGLWEYCCDCERFSPSQIAVRNKASEWCIVCKRQVARRYLCHICLLFVFDSNEAANKRVFDLSPERLLGRSCPGCLSAVAPAITNHLCAALGVEFATSATECAFCNERIWPPVAEQMRQLSVVNRHEEHIAQRGRESGLDPDRRKSQAGAKDAAGDRAAKIFAFEQTRSFAIKGVVTGFGALVVLAIILLFHPPARQEVLSEPQTNNRPAILDGNAATKHEQAKKGPALSTTEEQKAAERTRSSTLVISANTEGVSVSIDNAAPRRLFNENGQIIRLSPGAHKVAASKRGYERWERSVYLSEDNSLRISIQMHKEGPTPREKALEHLRRAEELTQRRQYDSALAEINEGLKLDPQSQLLLKKRNDLERVKQILKRYNSITPEKQGSGA